MDAGQQVTAAGPGADHEDDFDVAVEQHGASTVIAVSGELDVSTVPFLRGALTGAAARGTTRVVVDLANVTFIDSVSVGAVLHAQRRLGDGGRLAVVLSPSSYARVIFDVVGADAVLDVVETRAEALARVNA